MSVIKRESEWQLGLVGFTYACDGVSVSLCVEKAEAGDCHREGDDAMP